MQQNPEYQLTCENIDEAEYQPEINPIDQLRRIGKAWMAIGLKCECGEPPAACDVCEIQYLLDEAFQVPEVVSEDWVS